MIASVLLSVCLLSVNSGAQDEPIPVGTAKQLFIDNKFIESAENVTLAVNPPRWVGHVVTGDRPWEKLGPTAFITVLDDGKEFKMYYRAMESMNKSYFCLATSKDGLHWTKPDLGIYDYKGSKNNNIIFEDEGTPFIDPTAPADQRYRLLLLNYARKAPPEQHGLFITSSPDGIHWSEKRTRVSEYGPDTHNQVFYDTRLNKYVAYLRGWNPLRVVCRCEMDDLLAPWPIKPIDKPLHLWGDDRPAVPSKEIPTVISYDQQDLADTDIYNPAVLQYPWAADAYFAFPSIYRHFPEPPKGKYGNDGLLDIQLAVSRDGVGWNRPCRKPYVGLGTPGRRDAGQMYMGIGALRIGDELYQYYGGCDWTHTDADRKKDLSNTTAIFLVAQRLDGFMSADAGYSGGTLTTPLIAFAGKHLVLNIDCSALGVARVEILDPEGLPIKGFIRDDCEVIMGNRIAQVVKFDGKDDLASLAGKPVRLRFTLRAAKLFAFQFTDTLGGE